MKSTSYLFNLTPLRGIAALLTVIFHVDLMLGDALVNSHTANLMHRLYLMVDFFFILSGFILCHVYGNSFANDVNKQSFKKFAVARFSRVYPLHLVTLLYTIVLFYSASFLGVPRLEVLQTANNGFSIFTNLLLLHSMNIHNWFTWVHASWSISTEWWAYMLFPFLVKPFMQLNSRGRILVCLLCFGGYLCITFLLVPIVTIPPELPFVRVNPADLSLNVAYQYGFVRCLCGFILGMMMYQGFRNYWGKQILGNGFIMLLLAIAAFTSMNFNLPDIITVSFFPFLLLSGAYGSQGMNQFFVTKPLQRLGDWSFSIYLVHQPLMFTIFKVMMYLNPPDPTRSSDPPPPGMLTAWLICFGFIGITLLLSYFTYRFVEVPARRRLNAKVVAVA